MPFDHDSMRLFTILLILAVVLPGGDRMVNAIGISRVETQVKNQIKKVLEADGDSSCVDQQFQKETPMSKPFNITSDCEIQTPNAFCLNNGERMFLPGNSPKNLLFHFTFEYAEPLDSSKYGNHASGKVSGSAGCGGQGQSGFFKEGDYLSIPKIQKSDDFSLTFFLYVLSESRNFKGEMNCPLVQVGDDDKFNKLYNRKPAVYLNRKTGLLNIYITSSDSKQPQGELLTSKGKIQPGRWLHIAIVKETDKVKLYLNGILDSELKLSGVVTFGSGSVYIGKEIF